jgi:hypothetical protein
MPSAILAIDLDKCKDHFSVAPRTRSRRNSECGIRNSEWKQKPESELLSLPKPRCSRGSESNFRQFCLCLQLQEGIRFQGLSLTSPLVQLVEDGSIGEELFLGLRPATRHNLFDLLQLQSWEFTLRFLGNCRIRGTIEVIRNHALPIR